MYLSGPVSEERNSNEEQVLAGVNFDITNLVRGEFGVGYIDRSYRLSSYRALSGVALSAKVEYFPTQLLTLTLTGQRLIEDAAFTNASGYFDNEFTLQADYAVRRDLILTGIASLDRDDFVGVTRSDTAGGLQVRGTFFLNRSVGFNATLGYKDRTSSGPEVTRGPQYNEVRFGLGAIFQR
jgi:hypothetical protein